ncbi:MAG: iron ABC transporter permease [Phenylobacterium sp.]|uniref:FecCD family ABC transporter permease n=1 Tax=Phenylobacterium sp. TaxID=1871053 RepID=UPI0025F9739F|nr:iron ABC transporter permease [Phenylobacterium sp.]MCG9916052.1 iron ABC transporter permease [Phenylobacterium sp.]
MRRLSPLTVITGLVFALGILAALSLMAGRVWVPLEAWGREDPRWIIILELRIPRTLLAIVVGAALGMSGAALQGYTRNPLADPGVLGVSSMAALGAVVSLYVGFYLPALAGIAWLMPLCAMAGALVGVLVLIGLTGQASGTVTFVLAGVVLNIVAGAGVALALNLAPNPWAVNEIVNWLMGSLTDRSMADLQMSAPFVAVGLVLLILTRRALDALTLGEIGARSLGIDLSRTRLLLALGVGLAAGASVAVTGVIGFVGLVTPHLLRPFLGPRPAGLLLPSALGGAVIVLAGDILVRLIPSAAEVRLGVAMAALGGPFFLALLLIQRRRLA